MRATSWISGHGSERHASSTARPPKPARSSALATEIGFNDPLVRLDGARRPFRDLLTVVEDEHGLAEAHDHLHVVLDEQHDLARVAQPAHRVQQIVEERAVDAGGRLVEQDQRGIGHEHAYELDELLLAVGEVARVLSGQLAEPHELQQLAAPALRLRVRAARDDEQVLQRRQLREDADDLEGPADAAAGDLPGLEAVDALAAEAHAAGVEALDAGDAVEQRRLAGAVGTDEAVDAPGLQRQGDVVDGGHATEALAYTLDREHGRHGLSPRPLRVEPVPLARHHDVVTAREQASQRREVLDAVVVARRPAAHEHDEPRRPGLQRRHE